MRRLCAWTDRGIMQQPFRDKSLISVMIVLHQQIREGPLRGLYGQGSCYNSSFDETYSGVDFLTFQHTITRKPFRM